MTHVRMKIKTKEVEAFTDHINTMHHNIKFLDWRLNIKVHGHRPVYMTPIILHDTSWCYTDPESPGTHCTFDGREGEGEKPHQEISEKVWLSQSGFFLKSTKRDKSKPEKDETLKQRNSADVAGTWDKLGRIFNKDKIPAHYKRGKHTASDQKDKTARHKLINMVYAAQYSEECRDLYIGETNEPLHRHMAKHRRANTSGQDSAVHLTERPLTAALSVPAPAL